MMVYTPKNNVEDQIATGSSFAHGTDTSITLSDASAFPTEGGYIRIDDGTEFAVYRYTSVSAPDLTGLSSGTQENESVSSYTFPEGTKVELTVSAGYLIDFINALFSDHINETLAAQTLAGNLVPDSAGTRQIGESGTQFNAVYADQIHGTTYYEDLVFKEKRCEACGRKFQEGDEVILVVNQVIDDGSEEEGTYLLPMHQQCAGDG